MNHSARLVLRRLGHDPQLDDERQDELERAIKEEQARQQAAGNDVTPGMSAVPEELLTESEKRHEKYYRRQQAMAGRFTPAAERLPIMTAEERKERDKDRPKWNQTSFEGPIEKLIEKYGNLEEVKKHLTLGQSMKYEFTEDGKVLDQQGNLIFGGVKPAAKHV